MLRLEWTTPAADEFERKQAFHQGINPHAAQLLARRVHLAIRQPSSAPNMGRPGWRVGTRECVVLKTPCVAVDRVRSDAIEILHGFHERQDSTHAED